MANSLMVLAMKGMLSVEEMKRKLKEKNLQETKAVVAADRERKQQEIQDRLNALKETSMGMDIERQRQFDAMLPDEVSARRAELAAAKIKNDPNYLQEMQGLDLAGARTQGELLGPEKEARLKELDYADVKREREGIEFDRGERMGTLAEEQGRFNLDRAKQGFNPKQEFVYDALKNIEWSKMTAAQQKLVKDVGLAPEYFVRPETFPALENPFPGMGGSLQPAGGKSPMINVPGETGVDYSDPSVRDPMKELTGAAAGGQRDYTQGAMDFLATPRQPTAEESMLGAGGDATAPTPETQYLQGLKDRAMENWTMYNSLPSDAPQKMQAYSMYQQSMDAFNEASYKTSGGVRDAMAQIETLLAFVTDSSQYSQISADYQFYKEFASKLVMGLYRAGMTKEAARYDREFDAAFARIQSAGMRDQRGGFLGPVGGGAGTAASGPMPTNQITEEQFNQKFKEAR